ncbi:hypothetical protein M885DRAFT_494241 [Pelagophyceae sp. CCMP2097]|nr:hypothetical protein M885DRAFT_494241 [Pelagophyceae sp. CCMP2097]
MVTGRALWLPTVHSDETQFFAWSYLDLQSVEALGVDWREAAFVRNRGRRRPFDGVATLDVGGNEPLPPGRARTIVTVDVRPDLAAPPRQRNATATDDADDDAAADAAYGARRTVLRLSTRAPRDDDSLVWVAARLQSAELLLLRPTFLEHDHAQLRGSPTSIVGDVMRRLRWCDKALQPAKDVGVVTPASSCWGRGAALDG